MITTIKWNEYTIIEDLNTNESDFWKGVGKHLLEIPVPNILKVSCDLGTAQFEIKQRGYFYKGENKMPSMFLVEEYNDIVGLETSTYEEKYLVCINEKTDGGHGNYKFYHFKPIYNGIDCEYGRIGETSGRYGARKVKEPYPTYIFWLRYYEKLSKGYEDKSEYYLAPKLEKNSKESKTKALKKTVDTISSQLYTMLLSFAKGYIRKTCVSTIITEKMIEKSKELYEELSKQTTVETFNSKLKELLQVAPRKVFSIKELLAKNENDFVNIMDREDTLIKSMQAVNGDLEETEIFDFSKKIVVKEPTEKQKEMVLNQLDDNLRGKVRRIYRVYNQDRKKAFEDYIEKNHISKKKMLWHGSRNENWLSIIDNGLLINPNAVITGKMFGYGIYFAPNCKKSWGYTSSSSAYWTRENKEVAFMGLYNCAYGNPMIAKSARDYDEETLRRNNCDCVHAKSSYGFLYNDEIIFYNESAMNLEYIVEFNA